MNAPLRCLSLSAFAFAWLAGSTIAAGGQKLYVLNGEGTSVGVIDVKTLEIIGSIEVGKEPHGVAAPDSQDLLYVSIEGEGALVKIDPRTDRIIKRYDDLGGRPNEIDITSDGRFVYIPMLKDGVFRVFDTQQEKVVAEIPTDGLPHNVVISPDNRYAYLAPMDRGNRPESLAKTLGIPGSLNQKIYIVDAKTHTPITTVDTGDAPRPIAVSPDGKYLYVNTDELQGFIVIDLENRRVVARVEYSLTAREKAKPSRTHGIWVTPDGRELWTCDVNHGNAYCFDVTKFPPVEIARVETKKPTYWLEGTPDGKTLFAANPTDNAVSVIDVASHAVTKVIQFPAGSGPKRMLVVNVPAE